jgi:diguanylate cyclase (GGDEF)-like protein/PAS domain S-box-containing protein
MGRLRRWLSAGSSLPPDVWEQRHRWILRLLWLQVPAVYLFALFQNVGSQHALVEASIVAIVATAATVATMTVGHRRLATVLTSVGLMVASAVGVHLAHGSIEMHFSYFVMVGVVTLYQDWVPFLIAILFVVLQHGIGGVIDPASVYNHKDAVRDPWRWAAVHGGFILAMSAAGIASWRLNERLQHRAAEREESLAEAQEVARLGSWELDVGTRTMQWSDELYRLLGLDPTEVAATLENLIARVNPDDRQVASAEIRAAITGGAHDARDFRVTTPDGEERWLHCRIRPIFGDDDTLVTVCGTAQDISDRKQAEIDLSGTLSLLTATFDSTADGILVVDLAGRIMTFNQRFIDLWQIPADVIDSRDDARAIEFVVSQLKDPEAFSAKIREIYADPDATSDDLIEFLDGRIFERFSMPQRIGGETVGRVWSFRDVSERSRLEQELAHQAFHDSLTSLANQALFRDRVDHALARSARGPGRLAVLFIDLDDFKTVNDSLGHTAGDEFLIAAADRLQTCLRAGDSAARLGGDEFAVLLEDLVSEREAEEVAGRILDALQERFPIDGHDVLLSASVGIAFASRGTTCDQILRNADLAMYTAKRRGKHRFETYHENMHARALDRLEREGALRRGLERGELVVEYQPVVVLPTGTVVGVEALVRWDHPERGRLGPNEFVELAEETGLIGELGRQVLVAACHQAARWRQGHPAANLSVNVNVSPRQLHDDDFIEQVRESLRETGLSPGGLVLEITETAMMHDIDATIERLLALKALGVRLAVDDFGTGYSSLSYLQRFPVDSLKIDRAFVSAIGTNDVSLTPAILSLARTLGLTAVAEGVETSVQADALSALGCDLAQGYYFSRPVDAESITRILDGRARLPDAVAAERRSGARQSSAPAAT